MDERRLWNERATLLAESKTRLQAAVDDDRDLAEDEQTREDEITARISEIDRRLQLAAQARERDRQLDDHPTFDREAAQPPEAKRGQFGSLGEQLQAVVRAGTSGGVVDQRLVAAASGANETSGAEGGFAVQTDFATELIRNVHETGVLVGRTRQRTVSSGANSVEFNAIDETSRADGQRLGGISVHWDGEVTNPTPSQEKRRKVRLELKKLIGVYYATDDLLRDTTALQQEVSDWFEEEFGFKFDDAIINGAGGITPLGVLQSPALVTVAKEGSQAAGTILAENVEQMYARMWTRSLANAEWFINQDCWPQLFQLHHVIGTGGVPLFIPPGGLSGAPFGTLLNRPITPIEQCQSLGAKGDIIFADLDQYLTLDKGGIEAATSIHVRFLQDETAFRFVLRVDGHPRWRAALTPANGTNTVSPFIALEAR